ncbi:MAG TPA: hypothetical protein ENJ41_06820 [Oceanospirillales bacterium]|nr:hypothetical protein [Oceanospirillales bacterium]
MKILQTILLSSLTTVAIADTTLTYTDNKDNVVMKMQFADNKMKATSVDDDSTYMVYDANTTTFTTYMTDKKQYFVMGKEEIEALGDMSNMVNKILEKQLADMPAEQREMMRGMLSSMIKAQMPKEMPKPEYSLTGKTASYNGFDCEVVKKKIQKKKSEFCVSTYKDVGMSASEYAVITSFQHTIEGLAQQVGHDSSMDFSSLGDYIPVKYKQAGKSGTLKSVNHDNLDLEIFAIPAGFSKMEMPF